MARSLKKGSVYRPKVIEENPGSQRPKTEESC